VVDLAVPYDRAVTADQVAEALERHPDIDLVSLVHAEAATGTTNPVAEIGAVVRARGALLMLDAVASVAAEPLLTDEWGVDLCVIGGQKAMGGPAGVSAVAVSERAPGVFSKSLPQLPPGGAPSLAAPGTHSPRASPGGAPSLDRIEAEGPDAVIARHRLAAARSREGALNLGLTPYVTDARDAAPVATTVRTPPGIHAGRLAAAALSADPAVPLAAGGGALATDLLRVDHYGPAADPAVVDRTLAALSAALRR
jgi:aspartate aminotransferase-like enzyme